MCRARVIFRSFLCFVLIVVKRGEAANAMEFSRSYQEHLTVMNLVKNDVIDPCEDFFQHACGRYSPKSAPLAPLLYNEEAAVQFFESNRNNFSTRGGILLNVLYESCKQRKRHPSQWMQVGFLAEFSQWPFLHYQWVEADIETTWPQLAAQLAARGVPVFFEIFFSKNTIYVSPARISCPASETDIKAIIMSPATGVISEQVATIISSELLFFCKELSGELGSSTETSDGATTNNNTNDFFNEFFLVLGFKAKEIENSRKIQVQMDRLEQILAILQRTDTRLIVNFLIWKMHEALDYEDCFILSEEFEPLLLSEYWNWGVLEPMIRKDVAFASFLFQSTRFQKRRKDSLLPEDWTSFLDKKARKREFNINRIIKTYAKKMLSPQAIAADYANLEGLRKDTFFMNYFNMKSRQMRLSFVHDYFVDKENTNHPSYFLRKFLNFVIFTQKSPMFHYFSTESLNIWHDSGLFSSIDDLYAAIDCLNRQTELYSDEYATVSSLSAEQMEEILKFYRSFYEALNDYLFWLEGESFSFTEDYVLEHFNLNSTNVMFYSVAQLYCGRDDARYAKLINRSFMNLMEFQDAFECDIEVPMNPTVKCMCKDC